nr:pyridoxal 5'-phosphate synthase glutaminase subunit PdxT [Maliibacterium massiliense]
MPRIGVLAMQGAVAEHLARLASLEDITVCRVRTRRELEGVDGLILPGGESTAMAKLLCDFGMMAPLAARIRGGMPVWGTCAGMILLAKEIVGEPAHLGVMDIRVRRNAYGTQMDSFRTHAAVPQVAAEPLELVFIRAPWIERAGADVQVLARVQGHAVAARQGHMLATSFHPELTHDTPWHAYFARMVRDAATDGGRA